MSVGLCLGPVSVSLWSRVCRPGLCGCLVALGVSQVSLSRFSMGSVTEKSDAQESAAACDDCTRMHPVLRLYVLILGLYELPLIYSSFKAMHSKKPFTGFSSSLVPGAAERRIWIFLLTVLSISRFVAVAFPDDPGALANLALIHVAEAVYMGSERLIYNSKGGGLVILGIIFGNGILFSCVAIMA